MKKIFLLIGMICFAISANAAKPYASAMTENDTVRFFYCPLPSGDTVVYVITSDSTVSAGSDKIDPNGLMAPTKHSYFLNKPVHEKNVEIPEKVKYNGKEYIVTKIAEEAFFKDSDIVSLIVPRSVDTIGRSAIAFSIIEKINPLYCKFIDLFAINGNLLKNLDLSRCTFDTLNAVSVGGVLLQWIKFPASLKLLPGIFWGGRDLKFLILPPGTKSFDEIYGLQYRPTIFLSKTPPLTAASMPEKGVIMYPCGADSAYNISTWAMWYDSLRSCHFLNLDSGYMDLDSVCPWEVERKYGFHPDTVGVYIVEKHNPYDCDSFNIYFVKSFLDPGEIYDTTIDIEPNKEDTSVLWTWEGTGYAYNVYRDGDYITTVEQPYYLDTNIEMDVQYCYNFAPVNEKYCEGKWSTTNCYTMLNVGVGEADSSHQLTLYPNPAKKALFLTSGERYDNLPYEITDMTGRIVLQGRYNAAEGIRVSGLAKGIYLLRMEGKVGKFGKN